MQLQSRTALRGQVTFSAFVSIYQSSGHRFQMLHCCCDTNMWSVDIDEQAVLLPRHVSFINEHIPLHAFRYWFCGVQHTIPLSQRLGALKL